MPPACTTDEDCTNGEVCTDYKCVCPTLDTPTECQEITSVEDGCDQMTNLPDGTECSTGVCLEGSCCNPEDSQECCEASGKSWGVSENNGMGKCCKEGEMAIDGYCLSSCYAAMLNAGFSDTDFTIENSTVTYHTGKMHIDKDLDISTCDLIVKEAGLSIASNKYLRVNNLTSSASYLYNNDDPIFILSGAKMTAAGSITASTKGEGHGISNSGTITAGDFIKVTAIQSGRTARGITNMDDAIIIAKSFISVVAEGERTTGIMNLGTIEAESITSIAGDSGILNYSSILTENSIYGEGYTVGIESNGEKLASKNGDIIGKGYLESDGVQGSTLSPERITAGGIIKSCSKMNSCICYQPWRSVVDCN